MITLLLKIHGFMIILKKTKNCKIWKMESKFPQIGTELII